ncbi:MAG: hypothetical protein QMC77_07800 [Methanocellales archaeon]|nr:hypothetical protein [Methanocellales archaeon]
MEDFEHFAGSEHSSLEIERLLQQTVVFPLSIDVGSLFVNDRMVMIREIFDSHHPDVEDLAPKWERRVEEYGTIAG